MYYEMLRQVLLIALNRADIAMDRSRQVAADRDYWNGEWVRWQAKAKQASVALWDYESAGGQAPWGWA